jgi:cbb3-type cytochrome oxidase subunit 3
MSELNEATAKKSNGVFIGIILLLLVGIGVMAVMYSKKNGELNDCMNDNLELKQQMDDMNKMMTEGQRTEMRSEIYTSLAEVKARLLADMAPRLVGSVVEHLHTDEEEWGKFVDTPVDATVTSVAWTYEDGLLLTVAYRHPVTGEECEGTAAL